MLIFDPELKQEICEPGFLARGAGCPIVATTLDSSDAADPLDAKLDADVSHYLTDCLLVKVDIATMAHGLEGRSPMLDHEFMEFAASLPVGLKLNGRVTKYILKRAVRELLPSEIIDRPKKGFSVPLDAWFRHDLREMSGDLLLDGRLDQRGYFRHGAVKSLLEDHWRGSASWHNQLWALLMLESWHRMFIDERPSVAPSAPALCMGV